VALKLVDDRDFHDRRLLSVLSPLQGWIYFGLITQGGTDFVSLVLGHWLSGFQPRQFEPIHVARCVMSSVYCQISAPFAS
jgi:hypothetical protein